MVIIEILKELPLRKMIRPKPWGTGYLLPVHKWFPLGKRLHRFWLWWVEWDFPQWPWRPLCWADGRHEQHYKCCITCGKFLGWGYTKVWNDKHGRVR